MGSDLWILDLFFTGRRYSAQKDCVMVRPLRVETFGARYRVTARGKERARGLFPNDGDRQHWRANWLENASHARFGVEVHTYRRMGNHDPVLMETAQGHLLRAMQRLRVNHTFWFNRRHGRVKFGKRAAKEMALKAGLGAAENQFQNPET